MISRNTLFLLFTLAWAVPVSGQVSDAGMWMNAVLGFDLGKGLEGSIAPEIRLNENLSQMGSFFSDFGIQKKINDVVSVGAEYRVGARRKDTWYDFRNRFTASLLLRHDAGDFGFSLNTRSQLSPSWTSSEGDIELLNVFREKFGVKYTGLKKTDLSTSFEVFTSSLNTGLAGWRWQCGIERKLDKRHFVSAGYLIQKDLSDQDMDFVVLLSYKWDVDTKKKKKKGPESPAAR